MPALQFAPFLSAIDSGFWYQLTQKKLDVFKLDDAPVNIHGFYSNRPGLPPVFNVDFSALEHGGDVPPDAFRVQGLLLNTNTLEDFKNRDKRQLLQDDAQQVWAAIKDGRALDDPSLLQRVFCLTFADLKKYHYYYWMAFPALTYPETVICEGTKSLKDVLDAKQVGDLWQSHAELKDCDHGAFLVHLDVDGSCSARALRDHNSLKGGKMFLGFSDPSGLAQHPGWPLRNLLALAAYVWGGNNWEVVCLRGKSNSIVLTVQMDAASPTDCPEAVGWEKNKEKLVPRMVDMSASMDPHRLAESAVDLNLKLMRWRLSPDLNLHRIKETRCLLLGAGTLGCNVARCLLGWGVRHITLVDNSKVSYSNPVRQTLFAFEDSKNGGVHKATAAATALKTIFPGVDSKGRVLNIPMPGHSVPQKMETDVRKEVEELEQLVKEHDVVFLLMDTRESRWLPTLLAQLHNKLVMNAALGFDTFLVMRHGLPSQPLGCYFCNDVVAPGNSTQDRTLDQQCTVTRPGLSFVASALVVELMVSLLQHPLGVFAPASTASQSDSSSEFGLVPHQIRGYLDRFQNILLTSRAFDRCTACSPTVLECYKKEGFDFLLRTFNDPNHLELITGLSELMSNISMDEILALSDDDSA